MTEEKTAVTTDEAPAEVVEYLKGEIDRLRSEVARAEADFQDAARRSREHAKNIAALEGVLRMLEPAPALTPRPAYDRLL